ncbi:MAG: two-component regulator propeller domain-containing protein [Chryseotalea sp.]
MTRPGLFVTSLLFTTLVVFNCVQAQPLPEIQFNPKQNLQDVSVTNWSTHAGLSSNNVTSFFQDSRGLIWLTSFNGFMSFDGRSFDIYDRNSLNFIEIDGFYSVLELEDGSLLFGSQGSGIVIYKDGIFQPFKVQKGKIPLSIRKLLLTSRGEIVVGTTNLGAYIIKNQEVIKLQHEALLNSTVMALTEDKQGNVWIATDGEGAFKWNGETIINFNQQNGLRSNNIEALAIDKTGNVLAGTSKGLHWLNHETFQWIKEIGENQVNAIWVDAGNHAWVGLERGLIRLHLTTKASEELYAKRDIDFVRITSITPDKEGNLWLTSNRSGLIKLRETSITNLTKPVIPSNRVNIIKENNQTIYIGTDTNIMSICKKNSCKQITVKTLKDASGIRDVYIENEQSIWLASYSGIIHIENGKETVYNKKTGMPAEDFRVILKDKSGNFWFGSRSGGLVEFRNKKILTVLDHQNGLESNYVMSIAEAPNGDIYVGTHSGGLSVIKQNGNIKTYHLKEDDSGVLLFNIDIDKEGRVWVMANQGPLYFDGDSLQAVSLKSDKRSKTFFDWVDDGKETMYITTNVGILQIKKQELLEHISGKQEKVSFFILDDADGMNNKECTGATSSFLASNGLVYVPTLGGVCIIDSERRKVNNLIPPVRIAHFKTDTVNHLINQEIIRILAGALRYSFKYSVLSYSAPSRNLFRYKLEGLDANWSEATHINEVEYTNLQPGTYTFRISASNDNAVWNTAGASLTFIVEPYFYQTIWFYITIIFAVMLLFYLVYKWRISIINKQNEALRKVNAELDRFVYSASHDLRSPLSSLLGLINLAKEDEQWDKKEYLGLMEKSVKRLDTFIKDIIDFSRNARLDISSDPINFKKIAEDIFEDLSYMENFASINKRVQIDENLYCLSDEKRIRIILSNIIANAIKHHWPGRIENPFVEIKIVEQNKSILISVSDNGPGIPKEHLQNIFKMFFRATNRTPGSGLGLYIVQETVGRLGGMVTVQSEIDKGTTFFISLPYKKE